MKKTLLTIIASSAATPLLGEVLPAGKGAFAFGYRQFSVGQSYYDRDGTMKPIGAKFDSEFSAKQMSSGDLGSEFKRLYDEVKKYDSAGTGANSLADQMDFGRLTADVEFRTKGQYVGLAYGWTNRLTVYGSVPFVNSSVDTNLRYEGTNNAAAIKSRLGNLAFKEIQDALQKASRLSVTEIKRQVEEDYGYDPIDHWEYSGLGDVSFGGKYQTIKEKFSGFQYGLILDNLIELPTGHADDPDSLTDAPLSKGYIANTITAEQTIDFGYVALGLDTGVGVGLPNETSRRIPETDEALISKDRKVKVQMVPGLDTKIVGLVSGGNSLIKGIYKIGMNEHLRDSYKGSLTGNYGALEKDSACRETFHEIAFRVSTVDAYLSGRFAIPLMMTLTGRETIAAKNDYKKKYIELSIASFFKTDDSPTGTTSGETHRETHRETYARARR